MFSLTLKTNKWTETIYLTSAVKVKFIVNTVVLQELWLSRFTTVCLLRQKRIFLLRIQRIFFKIQSSLERLCILLAGREKMLF